MAFGIAGQGAWELGSTQTLALRDWSLYEEILDEAALS
jgi:hypothetical protein